MLADDNADMRSYVARLLGALWPVEEVSDGLAALEAVRRARPALVLSDVMMPRLDGMGLVRALRAELETKTLPVILLSARAGEEAAVEGLDAGANDHLVKPFSASDLMARVASQIASAKIREQAAAEREAQRELIEGLFRDAPAGIALIQGPDLVYKFANDRAAQLVGRQYGTQLMGRPLHDALPELRGHGFGDLLRNVMSSGESVLASEQAVPVRAEGHGPLHLAIFNIVYVPTRNAAGDVDGVATFAFDITQGSARSKARGSWCTDRTCTGYP